MWEGDSWHFASWRWSFFMHLVVLYGYQGAVTHLEQLALTDQLIDATLAELSVVAGGQLCMMVGDFNVEPTKILCLAKEISAGLWVDFEEAWALTAGLQPAPICKRDWRATGGHRRDFMIGCPFSAAAVLACTVQADRWIALHRAVRAFFDGLVRLLSRFVFLPYGLLFGCLLLIRVGGLSRLRFVGLGNL